MADRSYPTHERVDRTDCVRSTPSVLRTVVRLLAPLLVLASLGVTAASPAGAANGTLSGRIACRNGARVAGVWVAYTGGGSWATITPGSASWLATYTVTIPLPAENVRLHVGCGGTSQTWGSTNLTPTISIGASRTLSASCREAIGLAAERCVWWGATVYVGMPFAGTVNKFDYADVAPGAHPIYTGGGWADWSTDLYAAAGTAVRPRIYGPNSGYTLKIDRIWTGCAGKGVGVAVYKGTTKVGLVSYAHLDAVPAFAIGQSINASTVLGTLKLWPQCASWQVSTAGGVHTHIEIGTEPGTACYRSAMSTKTYPDARIIGAITPGRTATC